MVDGDVQVLKVGVDPAFRRRGVARELVGRIASDARNLGAQTCSLEVRARQRRRAGALRFAWVRELGRPSPLLFGRRGRAHHEVPDVARVRARRRRHEHRASSRFASGRAGRRRVRRRRGRRHFGAPLIFAIESSCDETAAAIVDGSGALLADVVASQIDFHARFGGVVPEIASRKHVEAICGVCDECLDVAARRLGVSHLRWHDLDAVSVTYAPGLLGALVVGVAFAKGAAWACDIPFIGVNHLEGHLYANKIGDDSFAPPAMVSLVSGGNTMLVHMRDWGDYEILGATIDDAVGEAFDKVAKALGLGYPGGPVISRFGAEGDPDAIPFPRAMMHSGDLRFSLSGLKTAVVTYVNQERAAGRELNIADICASFQQAVVDVQVSKARRAPRADGCEDVLPRRRRCGELRAARAAYEMLCEKMKVKLVMPPAPLVRRQCGMIALVALDRFRRGGSSASTPTRSRTPTWNSPTRVLQGSRWGFAGASLGFRRDPAKPCWESVWVLPEAC